MMGTRSMMDLHGSLLVKAVRRALVGAVAVGSMAVLLDAGAKYPGLMWRPASFAREPSDLEREVSAPGFTPLEFRLSENWAIESARTSCAGNPHVVFPSPNGDEALDNSCSGGATVNAVGDLPRAELLSWPSDWLYHRALHF
jgi:hypothetical protein